VLNLLFKPEDGLWNLDFGLWDNDYVCFVPMDKDGNVDQVRLSSRKQDLEQAMETKKKILEKATRIKSLDEDIKHFLQNSV
jgi:hypothetical protein